MTAMAEERNSAMADERNGATWIRDYLLGGAEMARASERLQLNCRDGIRHFSSVGMSVPLNQVGAMETELTRLEEDLHE